MNLQFTDDEIKAIKRYVEEGHGLVGTAGTLSEYVLNNMKLAELFGIKSEKGLWNSWDSIVNGQLQLLAKDELLTRNIPESFEPEAAGGMSVINLNLDDTKAIRVAQGEYQKDVFVSAYKPGLGASVYFTTVPEVRDASVNEKQFFYNALAWTYRNTGNLNKDIAVREIILPERIVSGGDIPVIAKVRNTGEASSITLRLTFDDVEKESRIVNIDAGQIEEVAFSIPAVPSGEHTLSVYAVPAPEETYLINNKALKSFLVKGALLNKANKEELIDLDGDGKYEFMNVSLGIDVFEEGDYSASFVLASFLGAEFNSFEKTAHFTKGKQNISILVPLSSLKKFDLQGPYRIQSIMLLSRASKEGSISLINEIRNNPLEGWKHGLLDIDNEGFLTGAYKLSSFQDPSKIVEESFVDYGIDTNNNKLFDFLIVNVTIDAKIAGDYILTAELGAGYDAIDAETKFYAPKPGNYIVSLNYSGIDIRRAKLIGQYNIKDVSLFYLDNREDYIEEKILSGTYSSENFESYTNVRLDYMHKDNLIVGEKNTLAFNIRNDGTEDVDVVDVLLLDEQENLLEKKTVKSLQTDDFKEVLFSYTPKESGNVNLIARADIKDDDMKDNEIKLTIRAIKRGADLGLFYSYNGELTVGKPVVITSEIYNRGIEKAKDVEIQFYSLENKDKGQRILLESRKLEDIVVDGRVSADFSYTPLSSRNQLIIVVNASNEVWPEDNTVPLYLEASYDAPDLEVYYNYNDFNFVEGAEGIIGFSIANKGERPSSQGIVKVYERIGIYVASGNYTETFNLLASQTLDSLASKESRNIVFPYTPLERNIRYSKDFLVSVETENDADLSNNNLSFDIQIVPQSKIVNKEDKEIKGDLKFVLMKFMNEGWKETGKELSFLSLKIPPKGVLKLDKIYNPEGFVPDEAGDFEIRAIFTTDDGEVYNARDSFHVFKKISSVPVPSQVETKIQNR